MITAAKRKIPFFIFKIVGLLKKFPPVMDSGVEQLITANYKFAIEVGRYGKHAGFDCDVFDLLIRSTTKKYSYY